MDFFQIRTKEIKKGGPLGIYPDFVVGRSKDLMVRGRAFYAIWDEEKGLWSTDEYDVQRLIDKELYEYAKKHDIELENVKFTSSFDTQGWTKYRKFINHISDNSHQLDNKLTFANTEVKKEDYVSRRLPYNLASGDHSAWDELLNVLYAPEERAKIEWAIGCIVSGDSKKIEKFLVFYGPGGTGKSTIMKIIQKLFEGYIAMFDAKALTSNGNAFATEAFKSNPLVAIQHDGDLSRIEDNTKLNSIVSHEDMSLNEKYKPQYTARINAFLFMGTNKPVRITDAKSGIIRRLIDVKPTRNLFSPKHYHALMARIDFELGAIAQHCLDVYLSMGKNYYNGYRPTEMMLQTDVFFNFVEAHFDIFKQQNGTTLKQAYTLYKEYCADTGIDKPLPQYKVREELRNYFEEFKDRAEVDGVTVRSYYHGFTAQPFKAPADSKSKTFSLVLDETTSIFDHVMADQPAQYAKEDGTPKKRWIDVRTTLSEIDTSEIHYVKVPEDHIVIDFDLKDENGEKSLERNLEAASEWPATYAELSKSGSGVHLHYLYVGGDPQELARQYSEGIEIKVYAGDSSLRRKLSKCNNVPVAEINSGLPYKEKKNVLPTQTIESEKGLRALIERNLNKEIHPGTKPSVDFIKKIVDDYYDSGKPYDISDLRPQIIAFANNSSNQPLQSLKVVTQIKWHSDETVSAEEMKAAEPKNNQIAFYDVETFPNLFVVCWGYEDMNGVEDVVKMINPSPADVEALFIMKLAGFNCRNYDNHMLYARMMGYNNEQLYRLSKKIIEGSVGAKFGAAYDISYTDIYDFSSKKQSLKKWEFELGIKHMELDIPWDQPVPEERWVEVAEYCANDVFATREVFRARKGDWTARLILAELSGLTPNDTTQKHAAAIIFNGDRNPQRSFVYTDLSKDFPGYVYDYGKSTYRDEVVGEGGYVYAEEGFYENVGLFDVASMHPTSIIQLNAFGQYTPRFQALLDARLAIKRKDLDTASEMFDGRLRGFLVDKKEEYDLEAAKDLEYALKIAINIVYGLTSAKFDNPFRDPRNKDNIVAKRGALFMIDLKHALQEMGVPVIHIKTDSVKIPNVTPEIADFIIQFGEKYGYTFEHEATYDKFCLVNDAVYVAKKSECLAHCWTAVGAQFQHPYVFKTLFDPGPYADDNEVTFDDLCETKQVSKGAMYLDFNSNGERDIKSSEEMLFVGRTGQFVPVREGFGGGVLYRVNDGKFYAVAGTKGFLWHEANVARDLPPEAIDTGYFESLANAAKATIEKYVPFEDFIE